MSRNALLWRITTWFLVCVFVLVPISSVFAQEEIPDVEEPVLPKGQVDAVGNTADPAKQETSEIYLPMMQTQPTTDVGAAATNAIWRTVVFEGFEGAFPTGSWSVQDYDGNWASGNWDDTYTKSKTGSWSAHPTDGLSPYPNGMTTIMRYGPFSLRGATDARLKFDYYLDTEAGYDFFTWGYSCSSLTKWTEKSVSGYNGWLSVTESMSPCKGKARVWVQFMFRSDYSVIDQGVWVDNIRIEKYQ